MSPNVDTQWWHPNGWHPKGHAKARHSPGVAPRTRPARWSLPARAYWLIILRSEPYCLSFIQVSSPFLK